MPDFPAGAQRLLNARALPSARAYSPARTSRPRRGDQPVVALAQDAVVSNAALPRDLAPWGMFVNADKVVKAVLVGLAFAFVVAWTVSLAKGLEIAFAKRRVRTALNMIVRSTSEGIEVAPDVRDEVGKLVEAAETELKLLNRFCGAGQHQGADCVAPRAHRSALQAADHARHWGPRHHRRDATPFVGLFGTVWGIMNSFIGISMSQTTNLAVVAPGIAEALLATAFGLAAAIPAVVLYNMFARSIGGYRALLGDAAAEVLRSVSRKLGRRAVTPTSSASKSTRLPSAR